MALKVGELFTELKVDRRGFDTGLSTAKRALQEAAGHARAAEGAVGRLNGVFRQVATTAAGFVVAQVGMKAMGAAVNFVRQSVIGLGFSYNTLQQSSRAALTTILGGAEAANAQMDKLDAWARTSPFAKQVFIRAQQQLLGFGLAAEKVIPALEAIQNAVAAVGGGNDDVANITDALAQLQGQGKLTSETLNRLGQYGINAAEIIGAQMGLAGHEIREMASRPGGIPVERIWDPLVAGLQERFGGAAANVKETWIGATDRIKAAWRDIAASIAEPFLGHKGGGLAITWANKFADVLRAVEKQIPPLMAALDPLISLIDDGLTASLDAAKRAIDGIDTSRLAHGIERAVAGFKGLIGTLQSGGIAGLLSAIVARIESLGNGFYTGAFNAMRGYAQGLVDGANHYIQQAVQYIADLISAFLIGHSPPETGPLSEIDRGGQRVMEAYGEGMQAGLGPVYAAVEQAAEAFRTLDTTAALEEARRGLEAARGNLAALEDAAKHAEGSIRDLDRAAAEIETQMRAIRQQADDVTRSYEDQIRPLEEQLEVIRDVISLEERRRDIALSLQEIEVTRARIEALGDPELRAELAGRLSLIQARQEEHAIAREIKDIERQIREAPGKRDGAPVDVAGLRLRLEELRIRQELLGLVDQEALAQAEADQTRVDAQQDLNALDEREKQLKADILALPLEEKIRRLKREQQAALKPLQDQLRLLERQRDGLDEQRRQWQLLKQDIADALEPLKDTAGAGGRGAGGLDLPPIGGGLSLPTPELALPKPPDTSAIGENIGRGIIDGMVNYVREHVGRLVGAAIGAGLGRLVGGMVGSVFGPVGALIGGLIGGLIGDGVQKELAKRDLGPAFREMWGRVKAGDWEGLWESFRAVLSGLWDIVREQAPGMIQAGIDLLAKWGDWAFTDGWALMVESLASWGAALVEWVNPRIPDLLREAGGLMERLGTWALTVFLPYWISKLGEWGAALVAWIAPRIPELLKEADQLLTDLGEWMRDTALPAIWEKLKEWGAAFLDWIKDEVVPYLSEKLDEILDEIGDWLDENGKPWVKDEMKDFGKAIVDAIIDGIREKLPDLRTMLDVVRAFTSPAGAAQVVGGRIFGGIRGRQGGGTVRPGEMTLVGEVGPELVRFPAGSTVIPHSATRQLVAAAGGGRVGVAALRGAVAAAGVGAPDALVRRIVRDEMAAASQGAPGGIGPTTDVTLVNEMDGREISRAVLRNLFGQVRAGVSGNAV